MNKYLAPNNRPTIAFFTAEIEGEYSNMLCQGALDSAETHDVNLILFPGKAINSPYLYQHQYNVIYDLVTPHNVDALIIPLSIFHVVPSPEPIHEFCHRFAPLPTVTINLKIPGASGILIDNKKGLTDLLEHMIREHGRRRIAFIKGTRNNVEAEERYSVYCDVLEKNGIPFDRRLVCSGDFTLNSVPKAVHGLLDEKKISFDVLCAANDEMALAALELLSRRGLRIPDDVAVIGFDNVDSGRLCTPPLSTVRQPIYEMGKSAVEHALALLRGEPATTVTLPTSMVIRRSCGCNRPEAKTTQPLTETSPLTDYPAHTHHGENVTIQQLIDILTVIFDRLLTDNEEPPEAADNLHRYLSSIFNDFIFTGNNIYRVQELISLLRKRHLSQADTPEQYKRCAELFDQARLFFSELQQTKEVSRRTEHDFTFRGLRSVLYGMFPYVDDRNQTVVAAAQPLKSLGIRSCSVYLYGDEIFFPTSQTWTTPGKITLAMAYSEELPAPVTTDYTPVNTKSILHNRFLPSGRRYSLIINPLFFLNYQMGLIICELDLADRLIYESLFVEMGCVLKFSHLISDKNHFEAQLRDALDELEINNRHLSDLSQTDELTGLYNRRGFLAIAGASFAAAAKRNAGGLLIYADLDGLKTINDTWGHEEGDIALQAAAMLLRKTFRSSDIVGRIGGDEFTVLAVDTTLDSVEAISRRLALLSDEFNTRSERPFRVSISFGAVAFPSGTGPIIQTLMAEADRGLLEQKRRKKNKQDRVSRNSDYTTSSRTNPL